MPPVFGRVAVADPLVILRRGERQHRHSVTESEEAGLLAFEELLDDDGSAGCTEGAVEAGVDGQLGLGSRCGNDDALAGGKAVSLDDDRKDCSARYALAAAEVSKMP